MLRRIPDDGDDDEPDEDLREADPLDRGLRRPTRISDSQPTNPADTSSTITDLRSVQGGCAGVSCSSGHLPRPRRTPRRCVTIEYTRNSPYPTISRIGDADRHLQRQLARGIDVVAKNSAGITMPTTAMMSRATLMPARWMLNFCAL